MKYYTLEAVVNGSNVKLKRNAFTSRSEAIEYMFKYYEDHYMFALEVNDEHIVDNNRHQIEYVCDFHNRFTVTRHLTAM